MSVKHTTSRDTIKALAEFGEDETLDALVQFIFSTGMDISQPVAMFEGERKAYEDWLTAYVAGNNCEEWL